MKRKSRKIDPKSIRKRRQYYTERIEKLSGELDPIEKKRDAAEQALIDLQCLCPHPNVQKHGPTGYCPDCERRGLNI